MKKILTILFVAAFMVALSPATRTFILPGAFSDSANWDTLPETGDSMVITTTCTVSADAVSVYGALTIAAGASFGLGTCSMSVGDVSVGGTFTQSLSAGTGITCSDLAATTASLSLGTGSRINLTGNLMLASGAFTATTSGNWFITGSSGIQTIDFGSGNAKIRRITFACPLVVVSIPNNFQPSLIAGTGGTVISSVVGTQRTLTTTLGGSCTTMSFRDIKVSPIRKLDCKTNCTNLGNCSGITFKDKTR